MRLESALKSTLRSVSLAAAFLVPGASGSSLLLDGAPAVVADMGAPLTISIGGTPGDATILFFDVAPGPTPLFGQSVAIGFSPYFGMIALGAMPPGGAMHLPLVVPEIAQLEQATVYLVAAVGNPAQPLSLGFSNGAILDIVKPPTAGPPRAVMVGNEIAIGSEGLAAPDGTLKPGASVSWSLISKPAGSTAVLAHVATPRPSLVPDVPGDYVVSVAMTKWGKAYQDTAVIHACRVTLDAASSGGILAGDSAVSGTLEGPPGLALEVDGTPVTVSAQDGAFGPVPVTFGSSKSTKIAIAIEHPDGSEVIDAPWFAKGVKSPIAGGAKSAVKTQFSQGGITDLAELAEAVIESVDIEPAIKALPPTLLVNQPGPFGGTAFSAYADVLAVGYDPDLHLTQAPKSTGLDTTVVLNDVVVTVKVYGEIVNVPYSVTGIATANPATFKTTASFVPNGSSLNVNFASSSFTLSNFSLSLASFPGSASLLSQIANTLKPYLQSALSSQLVTATRTAMKLVYEQMAHAVSLVLESEGVGNLVAKFEKVVHGAATCVFENTQTTAPPVPKPGAPTLVDYLSNSTLPPLIPTSPPSGAYDVAVAFCDDFLNQALASAVVGGLLEKVGQSMPITVGELANLIPALDLTTFAATLPVKAHIHAKAAPFVAPSASGLGDFALYFGAVEITLVAVLAAHDVPLVRLAIDGSIEIDVGIGSLGRLEVTEKGMDVNVVVLDSAFITASDFAAVAVDDFLATKLGMAVSKLVYAFLGLLPVLGQLGTAVFAFVADSKEALGDAAEWLTSYFDWS
jgi:hypothetical protein